MDDFRYSYHQSVLSCIDNVRRNKMLVTLRVNPDESYKWTKEIIIQPFQRNEMTLLIFIIRQRRSFYKHFWKHYKNACVVIVHLQIVCIQIKLKFMAPQADKALNFTVYKSLTKKMTYGSHQTCYQCHVVKSSSNC